jgi:poly(A)-specific ribonuclease
LNASPTLQEIAEGLSKQRLPRIATHSDHAKYQETEAFHEAGYDSLLTATIMIKLAAKLGTEKKKQAASTDLGAASEEDVMKSAKFVAEDVPDVVRDGQEKVAKPVPLPPIDQAAVEVQPENKQKKRKNRKKSKTVKEAEVRRFHTKNIFDSLREMRTNPEDGTESSAAEEDAAVNFDDVEASATWDEAPAAATGSWADEEFVQDKTGWVPIEQADRHAMEFIPKLDDAEFWTEYGNTLRVFGTEEAVLKIADW